MKKNQNDRQIEMAGQIQLPVVFGIKKINNIQNQQLKKKKVLKPIRVQTLPANKKKQCTSNTPHQTIHTSRNGAQSNILNVNDLLINDHVMRIKKLENELIESHMKTREMIVENRLLKAIEKRHENALSVYECKQAKLPQTIKSYEGEIRSLKIQIRQIKNSFKEMESRYKKQNTELLALRKQSKQHHCKA